MNKLLSLNEIIQDATDKNMSFGDYALKMQAQELELTPEEILKRMQECIQVMRHSVQTGLQGKKTRGGLAGGESLKLAQKRQEKNFKNLTGDVLADAIQYSLAVGEANACMGKIVAAPTAGASGVIPGVFFALEKQLNLSEQDLAKGLVVAGVIGAVIASRASLAGAIGGCQAECGSAASMAAGAAVDFAGGSPEAVGHAAAITMKNMLGLVCDPVAGLVEVPCIKRNAGSVAQALTAAQMALADITSFIPVDEVFDAMKAVGNSMPCSLKETAGGGIATSPTALAWAKKFMAK